MKDKKGRTQQINFKIKPELKKSLEKMLIEQNEMATDFFEKVINSEVTKHKISKIEK